MIVHVLENARRAGAQWVVVATDDERIAAAVTEVGAEAVLTSPEHASGTDRIAEVVRQRDLDPGAIVVNVQGDEPLLPPGLIRQVAHALHHHPEAGMATVGTPISDATDLFNPNIVKVVTRRDELALYFSRAPIPWVRDGWPAVGEASSKHLAGKWLNTCAFLRHIGLYAYRLEALLKLASSAPVPLEQAERLEQLRALWYGIGIHVTTAASAPGHGVDTAQDLERVGEIMSNREGTNDGQA